MIQRIQTIFMLLSVAACICCLCNPLGHFFAEVGARGDVTLYNLWLSVSDGTTGEIVHKLTPWVALFALLVAVTAFTFMNMFIYKHRTLQMRTLVWAMVVLVGYYIVGGVFVWRLCQENGFNFRPTVFTSLPLVSLILDYLAYRAVGKDEALVRSLDRLR